MPPSQYDGNHPVLHKIRGGESLSLIADRYGFREWEPIWVYNTEVHRILGPDPDLIRAGTEIFIPRSRAGYDRLLRKLQSLKAQVWGQADQLRFQLEGEHHRHQGTRVLFDFAGDVATLLGTVGFKAAKAARAAKTASTATGNAKAAARYLAEKEARELRSSLTGTLKDKAVNALMTEADPSLGRAHKDLYLTQRKGVRAIRGVSLQGGKSFLDIADILLDYTTPSNVADGFIALLVGETPGQTYRKALEHIRRSARSSSEMLAAKIRKYTGERNLLYG